MAFLALWSGSGSRSQRNPWIQETTDCAQIFPNRARLWRCLSGHRTPLASGALHQVLGVGKASGGNEHRSEGWWIFTIFSLVLPFHLTAQGKLGPSSCKRCETVAFQPAVEGSYMCNTTQTYPVSALPPLLTWRMKQSINIKLLLGYFRTSVQSLFLPPTFLWSPELNPPDAPGLEPQGCSFPGSKATKTRRGKWSHEQPMALVVGGCMPSTGVLPQGLPGCCHSMPASVSSSMLLFYPFGHICRLTVWWDCSSGLPSKW